MKYVTSGSTIKANISRQNFMSLHFEELMNEKKKKRREREGGGEKSKQRRGLPNPLLPQSKPSSARQRQALGKRAARQASAGLQLPS